MNRVIRTKPKGRKIDTLVAGEYILGYRDNESKTIWLEVDVHTDLTTAYSVTHSCVVILGRRRDTSVPHDFTIGFYDTRPLKTF